MAYSPTKWHCGRVSESQKVTQQPALTTASGNIWLLVGGIISLMCLVMLWFMRDLEPQGAATLGIVSIIVGYLIMIAIRYGVAAPRVRLWSLTFLTLAIAGTFMTIAVMMVFSS